MPNEESECLPQVVRCIHLPFLLIQLDNCDFEAEEIVNGSLNYFRQKIAADLAEKFASENLIRW